MVKLGLSLVTIIPFDTAVAEAGMKGIPLLDYNEKSPAVEEITKIKYYLKKNFTF